LQDESGNADEPRGGSPARYARDMRARVVLLQAVLLVACASTSRVTAGRTEAPGDVIPIACGARPPPVEAAQVGWLRDVMVGEQGSGGTQVVPVLWTGSSSWLFVDKGALAGTLRDDLAHVFAAIPASAAPGERLRLEVRVADVATARRSGVLQITVASRVVLDATLRAGDGAGEERWRGSFEGRAEKRVYYWRRAVHAETFSEAYCTALEQLASVVPRAEAEARLDAPAVARAAPTRALLPEGPPQGSVQVHSGVFAPRGSPKPMFALVTRVAGNVFPALQVGGALDWHHAAVGGLTLSGAGRTVPHAELDEFPLLAYVQLGRPGMPDVLPYVGIGGGYDLCFVASPETNTEIFGRWGWQAWAGIAKRLWVYGRPTHATFGVEAFYDGARPARSFRDASGVRHHEVLDLTGAGIRVGMGGEY
jgi:hypothetical protein